MAMGPEEMLDRMMERLQVTGDWLVGYGWKARVNRVLEKSSGYLSHAMTKQNLSLRTLFEVLQYLDKDLPEFLLEAGACGRTWSPLARLKVHGQHLQPDLPPAVQRVAKALRSSFGNGAPPLRESEQDLIEEVVTQRFVDPREAARLAEATLEVVLSPSGSLTPGLALPMLAEWASARRACDDPDAALWALLICLDRTDPVTARRGDLLQRLALCYTNHFGDYEGALSITHEALAEHLSSGNPIGVGRALVDRATWLYYLKQQEESIAVFHKALEVLPTREVSHRYFCFVNLALAYRDLGARDDMLQAMREARAFDEVGPLHVARLAWLEGSVAAEEKRFPKAEAALEKCRLLFFPYSPVNAALVSLELFDVYFANERPDKALEIAREMFHLVEPLERFPQAAQAVADLVAKAASAKVSVAVLRSTRSALLEARAPRGARAPICA